MSTQSSESNTAGQGQQTENENQGAGDLTLDTWLGGLDETQKKFIEEVKSPLAKALKEERDRVAQLKKELNDAKPLAEKGSKLETELQAISSRLEAAERRNAITTELSAAGVKNLELAATAAENFKLFRADGRVDVELMRERFPELFPQADTRSKGSGDAGAGGNQAGKSEEDRVNAFLRRGN